MPTYPLGARHWATAQVLGSAQSITAWNHIALWHSEQQNQSFTFGISLLFASFFLFSSRQNKGNLSPLHSLAPLSSLLSSSPPVDMP